MPGHKIWSAKMPLCVRQREVQAYVSSPVTHQNRKEAGADEAAKRQIETLYLLAKIQVTFWKEGPKTIKKTD